MLSKNKRTDEFSEIYDYQEAEKEKKNYISPQNAIMAGTIISILNAIFLFVRYFVAIINLQYNVVTNNILYIIFAAVAPIIMWVLSTNTEYWNFHNRKVALFCIALVNAVLVVVQPVYSLYWNVIVRSIFKIKTTEAMTEGMIILLAQVLLLGLTAGTIALILKALCPAFLSEKTIVKLKRFKISHHVDMRKNKEFLYDLKMIKSLKDGKDINIRYMDRFLHILVNGATGTGKTSSVFLPAIKQDLDRKIANKELREKELLKMLLEHKAYFVGPIKEFDEYKVRPKKGYEKQFKKIWDTYQDCGITVMAPNNSIIEDVLKLAKARNVKVNVLDPAATYEMFPNALKKGINPFFVPLNLSEEERNIRIKTAAEVFSEVLIAVNERNGTSDQYFTDISRSVTTNISVACMLARNIEGKQTNIKEIEKCISNFTELKSYINIIEEHFDMSVEAQVIEKKNGKTSNTIDADVLKATKSTSRTREEELARKKKNEENPYYQTIYFIKSELLGAGEEKMFDQARGLRNLVNKLLMDPRFKEILSADDEHRIDFDDTFSKNQITVINTALEFGSEMSTAFGLFYLLTQKASVLRRPKGNRSPHYMWVDEVSQYMHSSLEDMFTLYRQYKVGVVLAIQSLSQMEKSNTTKYLKNVFMGSGTHLAFGRLGPDEMETYSKMAGTYEKDVSQKTVNETSILSDSASISFSERITPTVTNKIEGSEMRYLDFQELTVLTVNQGRVLDGQIGKVSFLSESDFNQREHKVLRWESIKDRFEIIEEETPEHQAYEEPKETRKPRENDSFLEETEDLLSVGLAAIQTEAPLEHVMRQNILNYDEYEEKKQEGDPIIKILPDAKKEQTTSEGMPVEAASSPIIDLQSMFFGEDLSPEEELRRMNQKRG